MVSFAEKWGSGLFDPNDRYDQLSEAARISVLDAAINSGIRVRDGEDVKAVIVGMTVGVAQVSLGYVQGRPEVDATMRRCMAASVEPAFDIARAIDGLDPLPPLELEKGGAA